MSLTETFIKLSEKGLLPDLIIRAGIRNLCKQRIDQCKSEDCEANAELVEKYVEESDASPMAVLTDKANEQHYEVPASFYQKVLGKNLKYSCCFFDPYAKDLTNAEQRALELSCDHANLEDGMKILELGCGWGSLSLWMATN